MKAVTTLIIGLLFLAPDCFTQPTRADIIEKKIKSITQIHNDMGDSIQKITIKNYFSVRGDDSIEYYNGELSFKYITEFGSKGKVAQLVRYDSKDRADEWHMYKYEKNGNYTIEIIAHGAGTISLSKYDSNHRCLEDEIESSYKTIYKFNAQGKLEKILLKEKNKQPEVIGIIIYDKNGQAIKIVSVGDEKKTAYFKYNNKGLVSEMKTVYKDEMGKEQIVIVIFEYEFYDK